MAWREGVTVKYLQWYKSSLPNEYADQCNPGGWLKEYVDELTDQINIELRSIHQYFERTSDVKDSPDWTEMVHSTRRLIALRHQERELITQGINIPLLALQSNMTIGQGIW